MKSVKRRVKGPDKKGLIETENWEFDLSSLPKQEPYTPPSVDFVLGLLYGEIIWITKLHHYTYDNVTTFFCTSEEKSIYNKMYKEWSKDIFTERKESEERKAAWKIQHEYVKKLEHKYFPSEVIYREYMYILPTDKEMFARGIRTYLWDTDHCAYDFKDEDVCFSEEKRRGYDLKIKFTVGE